MEGPLNSFLKNLKEGLEGGSAVKKTVLLILSGLVLLTVIFLPGFSRLNKLRNKNEELLNRIKVLEEYNVQMEKELEKMHEDPGYLEQKAREKLGIVRKGEVIYRGNGDK